MTAIQTLSLRCDAKPCREQLSGEPRESLDELRRRSMRDHGWRHSAPTRGPERDLCRWHA